MRHRRACVLLFVKHIGVVKNKRYLASTISSGVDYFGVNYYDSEYSDRDDDRVGAPEDADGDPWCRGGWGAGGLARERRKDESSAVAVKDILGRGTESNPPNRYEQLHVELDPDDVPVGDEEPAGAPRTLFYRDTSRSILAENDSPDIGFRFSLNPYRGCEHGCIYCLGPETPILHADMTWRPIGEARVGDVLLGFDESCTPGETRKLRRSVIEAVWWSRKPTLRLVTERSSVVTTASHRWLQARDFRWSRTEQLTPGQSLLTFPAKTDGLFDREMNLDPDPVRAIEAGPVADVVDIQTSSRTFLAAGLATHNCYARPSHEYLGFSAGLDFERRIMVKDAAPTLLRTALRSRRWEPQVVALSGNTDCYQPVERRLKITRRCLEVFAEFRNPVAVITKSALVARDADVLAELARHGAARVLLSVTTLDPELARRMEPRAAQPERRIEAIAALARAGVPVGVMIGPVIPGLNDSEIPRILAAAAAAGADCASWVLLRLPKPLDTLFDGWLAEHYPERRERVLHRIRETRSGRISDSRFGHRGRGEGEYARQIAGLFHVAAKKYHLDRPVPALSIAAFRRPPAAGDQLPLLG
jgi:DNA repair photolyase